MKLILFAIAILTVSATTQSHYYDREIIDTLHPYAQAWTSEMGPLVADTIESGHAVSVLIIGCHTAVATQWVLRYITPYNKHSRAYCITSLPGEYDQIASIRKTIWYTAVTRLKNHDQATLIVEHPIKVLKKWTEQPTPQLFFLVMIDAEQVGDLLGPVVRTAWKLIERGGVLVVTPTDETTEQLISDDLLHGRPYSFGLFSAWKKTTPDQTMAAMDMHAPCVY